MKNPPISFEEFCFCIIEDFKKEFPFVSRESNYLYVKNDPTSMSIPLSSMYKDYCMERNYRHTAKTYIEITHKILNQYKFQINYKNVYPFLRHESFGKEDANFRFYRKPLFADIHQLYVSDEGEVFRYVLESDEFDRELLEKSAMENLNKMANMLTKIDDFCDIYTLRYTSDYGATLLLTEAIQRQIHRYVGQDYLFCIPSSTLLLVAKNQSKNIDLMRTLIMLDEDPNKISDNIYRCNHGEYSIVDTNIPRLRVIK